jgi:hypothetical protein
MNLYEEIIFLNQIYHTKGTKFNGSWIVENVASYYEPLIKPYNVGRHYFWSNFHITQYKIKSRGHMLNRKGIAALKKMPIMELKDLRNCVEPELGLHVFKCAFKIKQRTLIPQKND